MTWERENWVAEYHAGERISDLAERYQVSRKTLHKWIARYEQYGSQGLAELSRAPEHHPRAVDEVWRERVRGARIEHRRWGAEKIHWLLQQQHGGQTPSVSTVGRLLRECGLTRARRRTPKAQASGWLTTAVQPNQVWSVDFKGWCRTGDGKRWDPLTMSDGATRYLLCCQGLESTRTELVRPVMERVFCEYGLPQRIRSDNGAPFAATGGCGLTELSVWWIEQGIVWERIAPGRPQQNGRHERMHRTLSEATMQPPACTGRVQQRRWEQFRQEYNHQRPHQALGQQTPGSVYVRALRPYSSRIAGPQYPAGWEVRAVHSGEAWWKLERVFVSHALNGKQVGFEPIDTGVWRVWFYGQWLGVWDQRRSRWFRPLEWERHRSRLTSGMRA